MKFALTGLPGAFRRLILLKGKLSRRHASRGFSLLETLTALTILAVALSALFNAYSNDLRSARITERTSQAQILAQTLIAEATAVDQYRAGTRTGEHPPFTWSMTTTPGPTIEKDEKRKNKAWSLITIDVSVKAPDGRSFRLSTLKLGELVQ